MSFLINTIDSLLIGFKATTHEYHLAKRAKDSRGVAQAGLERVKNYVDLSTYAVSGVEHIGTGKISQIASIFAAYAPIDFTSFFKGISLASIVAGLAAIAAPLILAIETVSFLREDRMLAYIQNIPNSCETQDERERLKKCLETLSQANFNDVLKSLPDYLREKIQNLQDGKLQDFSRNGQNIFDHWISEINQGRTKTALGMLHEIRQGVEKKKCLHSIGILAALVTLIVIAGMFFGAAAAVISAIEILGIFLSLLIFFLAKGVVENHQKGFSWRLCFPAFIQKKLGVDREYNVEMNAPDYTWILKEMKKNGYSSGCSNDF